MTQERKSLTCLIMAVVGLIWVITLDCLQGVPVEALRADILNGRVDEMSVAISNVASQLINLIVAKAFGLLPPIAGIIASFVNRKQSEYEDTILIADDNSLLWARCIVSVSFVVEIIFVLLDIWEWLSSNLTLLETIERHVRRTLG